MYGPVSLIFRAGSWWGKPSKEFLVSLMQICLWFSKTKQMKHLELGGKKKKQFPNYVQPATKTQLLLFKQDLARKRQEEYHLQCGGEQRLRLQVMQVISEPGKQLYFKCCSCISLLTVPMPGRSYFYLFIKARSLQPVQICPSCGSCALCGRTGRLLATTSLTGKLSFKMTYLENIIMS